jgi:5-hydroxyisourate hydrolase
MNVYAQALDVVYGRPAAGVPCRLERLIADVADVPWNPAWRTFAQDGRSSEERAPTGAAQHGVARDGAAPVSETVGADGWLTMAQAVTGPDGRLQELTAERLGQGSYRIVFDSDSYFANLGLSVSYFEVSYAFRLRDEADSCHLQAMLGTHTYSIYSGTRS